MVVICAWVTSWVLLYTEWCNYLVKLRHEWHDDDDRWHRRAMKMYLWVGVVTRLIPVHEGDSTAEHSRDQYSLWLCVSLNAAIRVTQRDTKLTAASKGTNGLPIVWRKMLRSVSLHTSQSGPNCLVVWVSVCHSYSAQPLIPTYVRTSLEVYWQYIQYNTCSGVMDVTWLLVDQELILGWKCAAMDLTLTRLLASWLALEWYSLCTSGLL